MGIFGNDESLLAQKKPIIFWLLDIETKVDIPFQAASCLSLASFSGVSAKFFFSEMETIITLLEFQCQTEIGL